MSFLQEFGLTNNQALLYRELLEHGGVTAAGLSRTLKMDKSSAYKAIEGLLKQQLIIKRSKKRGSTYTAVNPDIFYNIIAHRKSKLTVQEKGLDRFIKELSDPDDTPSYVEIHEGTDAFIEIWESALIDNSKKEIREMWFLDSLPFASKEYFKKYIKKRIEKGIVIKELSNLVYGTRYDQFKQNDAHKSLLNFKEVRLLDWPSDDYSVRLYADTVVILYKKGETIKIITLTDKYISMLFNDIFDNLWIQAKIKFDTRFTTPI